jgi:transposase
VIDGLCGTSLIGCGIVEGNVDTAVFNTWVEDILIPDLPKNSVLVMDNAAFHKNQKTSEIIEKHGHKIEFLPPYSPDFNRIENKWAHAKSIKRKYNCDIFDLFANYLT